MKIKLAHKFEDIISIDNLLEDWKEFVKGKRGKKDVQGFSLCLMDNIIQLNQELANYTYDHGGYKACNINDPKPRKIHKAEVRDRLLHHAIYRVLYSFFDKIFIADSFSCRNNKGTHKAINRFRQFSRKVSQNNTKTCWILKCDIKKFFENINHDILISILKKYIPDKHTIWLLGNVIRSFSSKAEARAEAREERSSASPSTGLPLGNLTSQLFVNIYMNEFDQFAKHKLKAKYYIRYADDFVLLSDNESWLKNQIVPTRSFLAENLKLELHPDKLLIKTLASGLDFLGWVHFPDYRVLRTTTKRRMLKRIQKSPRPETFNSYFGLLKHGNTFKLRKLTISSG